MELRQITSVEYGQYVDQQKDVAFLQATCEAEKLKADGWEVEFISIEQDKTCVGAAMLTYIPLMKVYKYCYIPRGMFIDYEDTELVCQFVKELKSYLKSKKVIYLEIDPYIPLQQRDMDGNVVENGWNHFHVVDNLTKAGFIGLPRKQGYDDTRQCRWMSVLDLRDKTKDEILKEMNITTRQNINNTKKVNVKVRELAYEELNILHDIVKQTAERRDFTYLSLEYYQKQYEYFKDQAKAYYVYLDVEEYLASISAQKEKEHQTIEHAKEVLNENPHSKKNLSRLKNSESNLLALDKREKDALELQNEFGKEVPLAASMFIFCGREVVYLMSGSDDRFKKYKGPYALQWAMIQKAMEEGYDFYNFYGISGFFEKDQDGYGVFDFKRGFNAKVVELIGNYILPVNDTIFAIYNKLKHVV